LGGNWYSFRHNLPRIISCSSSVVHLGEWIQNQKDLVLSIPIKDCNSFKVAFLLLIKKVICFLKSEFISCGSRITIATISNSIPRNTSCTL
jgi:hypothetical protein